MARPYKARHWTVAPADPAACVELVGALGISPVMAQILCNRGLSDPGAARDFLECGRDRLLDPFKLKDMDAATRLLRERVAAGRPVLVYGDYDVDGVTGTAILVSVLRRLGARVEYFIPNRFRDGYGLTTGALERARAAGHDFILSVDTGTSALAEAAAARDLGMTLVITDHHEPGPELPGAAAVINPKRPDCPYPFKGLSGAGVAFKLAQALLGAADPALWDLLDIVALATVADMVPLLGENRSLVKEGLGALQAGRRPGIRALKEVAGIAPDRAVTATHISYALGPRLNALGRLGEAALGVELLLTEDPGRALELAQFLDQENRSRQEIEAAMLEQALAQHREQPAHDREFAAVLAAEGWHPGVVGICAAKVLEATYRPTILLSVEGDEARGSARSIPGFHLYQALYTCRDLLTRFGGHAAAAGLTLATRDIPELRERLNRLARASLTDDDLVPRLKLDTFLTPEQVNGELVSELARLEPHGLGNPAPLLALPDLTVADSRAVGREQNHLRLRLRAGERAFDGIGWGLAGPGAPGLLPGGARVQVACQPEWNEWNGNRRLQLVLADVRPAGPLPGAPAAGQWPPQAEVEASLAHWDPLADLDRDAPPPAPWPALAAGAAGAAAPGSPSGRPANGAPAGGPDRAPDSPLDGVANGEDDLAGALAPWAQAGSTRAGAVAALVRTGARLLVLVNSPWSLIPVATALRDALRPDQGAVRLWLPGRPCPPPEPERAQAVVAAWGGLAPTAARFAAAVAWHPPFHLGQAAAVAALAGTCHAAWQEQDWHLARPLLGWPYPDRDALVRLYRLLQAERAPVSTGALAARVAASGLEPVGPWNLLRVQSCARILAEIKVLDGWESGLLHILPLSAGGRVKMSLEDSARFRRGLAGRAALARCRTVLGSDDSARTAIGHT